MNILVKHPRCGLPLTVLYKSSYLHYISTGVHHTLYSRSKCRELTISRPVERARGLQSICDEYNNFNQFKLQPSENNFTWVYVLWQNMMRNGGVNIGQRYIIYGLLALLLLLKWHCSDVTAKPINKPIRHLGFWDQVWPKYKVTSTWIGQIDMSCAHALWVGSLTIVGLWSFIGEIQAT